MVSWWPCPRRRSTGILDDYSKGLFPPTFHDQAAAYQAETDYLGNLPGVSLKANLENQARKPFWNPASTETFCRQFARLYRRLHALGLGPGAELLELGCGSGWMAEFFALAGYSVTGTSIDPTDIQIAEARSQAFAQREMPNRLRFRTSAMEDVDERMDGELYDAVFVFEALHHAFDWKATIAAASRCLRPGGWFILANEPNRLHTAVSYRVAKISNTHEIGMCRKQLTQCMRACGFCTIQIFAPRWNNWISPHWIAARMPG